MLYLAAEYEYDQLGRRKVLTLGNDANAVYDYDLNNRLTKLTNNIDVGSDIVFEYDDYDKVGNRKSCIIDEDDNAAHVYSYDEIYRLVFVDYNDGSTTSYEYDGLGNRTETDDGTVVVYDTNCLNQYTDVGPQGSQTQYHYDKNGNLIDDEQYLYYYDCENRLTDVNDQSNDPIASYSYDYLGRRVKKTIHASQITIRYTYDGDQVIAEYENDTLVRKFIYGSGIDEPICMVDVQDNNAVYYYHFDGLGSVIALSDSSANIVERYSYDVFGEPNRTSDVNNPYYFTGRRLDTETHLYYYRARYYAYDIGRFLQADPIGYADGLNLYAYCGNNPLTYIDPSGLGLLHVYLNIKAAEKEANFMEKMLIEDYGKRVGYKVYKSRNRAIKATSEKFNMKPGKLPDDTAPNAYLHAYWSAEMTKSIGIVLSKEFTDAHELGIVDEFGRSQIDVYKSRMRMDLYNNMIGRALATAHFNKGKTTKEIIDYALEKGLLAISPGDEKLKIKRTSTGKGCP